MSAIVLDLDSLGISKRSPAVKQATPTVAAKTPVLDLDSLFDAPQKTDQKSELEQRVDDVLTEASIPYLYGVPYKSTPQKGKTSPPAFDLEDLFDTIRKAGSNVKPTVTAKPTKAKGGKAS